MSPTIHAAGTDEEGVRAEIERRYRAAGTMRALAAEWGVSVAYVSDLTKGRRLPGPEILSRLGLAKVVVYCPIPASGSEAARCSP